MIESRPTIARRPVAGFVGPVSPATGILIALLLSAGVVLMYAGHHLTFFYDEWDWIIDRHGGALWTYLDPHNGHFSLVPVAVYKLLFATVGLHHYWPYRAIGVLLHLLCATLLYVLARRRVGPWLALVPAALLLFMGTAYQDLLWPFEIGFLASIAGGLGALALIEDRRSDPLACALLTVSIASSGIGIPFLLAAIVALLVRRDPWQRLWVVAVPALVFVVWYLGWGGSDSTTVDAVLGAPQYMASAAADASAGIAGLDQSWGAPLLLVGLVTVTISWRRNVGGPPTALLAAAVVGALAFWGLAAIVRDAQPDPGASRYLYIGAVFMWLVAAEARIGTRLSGWWVLLAAVVVVGALVGNLKALRVDTRGLRSADDNVRASLTALEVAAPVVQPDFLPARDFAPQINAAGYLAAVRDLGSPAYSVEELQRADYELRQRADGVLEHAERLVAAPATSAVCSPGQPGANGRLELQALPGQSVVIRAHRAAVQLYLRRFATGYGPPPFAVVHPDSARTIRFPADRAPSLPWHVLLSGKQAAGCAG